jgi:hypothetical protein
VIVGRQSRGHGDSISRPMHTVQARLVKTQIRIHFRLTNAAYILGMK